MTGIAESAASTPGGSLGIEYGWNTTTFTDNQGRVRIYQFNNFGQTTAIRDTDDSAQFCEFNSGGSTDTQLKSISRLQKTSINLLTNHNLEADENWTMTSGTSYCTQAQYVTSAGKHIAIPSAYIGSRCVKLSSANTTDQEYAEQSVLLTPGDTYTLSAFFRGDDGACLSVVYDSTEICSAGISGVVISDTNREWAREKLTFTLPSDASPSVTIRVKLPVEVAGTTYADCVMLEEGDSMNRYNLLEDADFNLCSLRWIYSDGNSYSIDPPISELVESSSDPSHPLLLDDNVIQLTGNPNQEGSVTQTINISGSEGDCFTFGGWALVNTVPQYSHVIKIIAGGDRIESAQRRLKIRFVGAGSAQCFSMNFNPDCTQWQYICGAAIAPGDYTAIEFTFDYNYNANEAYFDGMQLFKEEFSQNFVYDNNGNLISADGISNKKKQYKYNGSNNLYQTIDPNGNIINYTYDTRHNLLTSTSETGMKHTYTYDSKGNALTAKAGSATEYIQTSSSYTATGSFLSSVTDARGKTVGYAYDANKGLRTSVTDANGRTSTYTYDDMKRLSGLSQPVGNGTAQVGYTYTNDDLTGVSHNGFTYGMTYDAFGNTLTTEVNDTTLSSNTYDYERGLLTGTEYGNGLSIGYTYDELDRVTEVRFGTTLVYAYAYDGDGNLQTMTDYLRDITTTYYYDLTNRLMRSISSDGTQYKYDYDLNNNLLSIKQTAAGSAWTTTYTYDEDNRPVSTRIGGHTITESYNATGTRANRVYNLLVSELPRRTAEYTVSMTYLAGAGSSKTGVLATYQNGSETAYSYAYDNNGNITSITRGSVSAAYVYDEMNQLVRVNDGFANLTTTYAYDLGGNITQRNDYAYTTGALGTPTDTVDYTYDAEWRDLLVSYDGQSITYDEIGNPLTYRGYALTWQGKRLLSLSGNGTTASYTYDEQGIRTSKTVNDVTTAFSCNGSLLMAQVRGSGESQIKQLYSYDASGQLLSVNYQGTEYFYLRNGQSDIVGLMDSTGTRVVEYTYDSWGKLLSTTGTLATTLGADNPFRYRGYYYDTETGLYYLQTRYYDPEVCRFISADVYMSTGQGIVGNNMFAYCLNSPVSKYDKAGTDPASIAEYWWVFMIWLPAIDGPIPIGDLLYFLGGLAAIALTSIALSEPISFSIPKAQEQEKEKDIAPAKPRLPAVFPADPMMFNPEGLVREIKAGTKNGLIINWMLGREAIFKWNENPNYPNGPHYHIPNDPLYKGRHFYAGELVPEPYATMYFGLLR